MTPVALRAVGVLAEKGASVARLDVGASPRPVGINRRLVRNGGGECELFAVVIREEAPDALGANSYRGRGMKRGVETTTLAGLTAALPTMCTATTHLTPSADLLRVLLSRIRPKPRRVRSIHYEPFYLPHRDYCLDLGSRLSLELGPLQAKTVYTIVTRMFAFHSRIAFLGGALLSADVQGFRAVCWWRHQGAELLQSKGLNFEESALRVAVVAARRGGTRTPDQRLRSVGRFFLRFRRTSC